MSPSRVSVRRPRDGNLGRDAERRLAHEGVGALPTDLAPWITVARLIGTTPAAVEHSLIQDYCGHLGASRLPGRARRRRQRAPNPAERSRYALQRLLPAAGRF